MKITQEIIMEELHRQLNEYLEHGNAEGHNEIIDIDLENQTITFKFDYHIVESDNYIGFGFY